MGKLLLIALCLLAAGCQQKPVEREHPIILPSLQ